MSETLVFMTQFELAFSVVFTMFLGGLVGYFLGKWEEKR